MSNHRMTSSSYSRFTSNKESTFTKMMVVANLNLKYLVVLLLAKFITTRTMAKQSLLEELLSAISELVIGCFPSSKQAYSSLNKNRRGFLATDSVVSQAQMALGCT